MPQPPAIRSVIVAAITGLLYPLCFPDFDLGSLAWMVLVPLHLALAQPAPPRRSFWLGWLAGTLAFAGIMFWVITAMHQYGKVPLAISVLLMLLLATYLGLFLAVYALGWVWFKRRLPALAFLAAPCLWVTLEWLRTYLFSGLPWALLGYSQYQWLPVIQIADITSVYGLSFLVILVNVSIAELILWGLAKRQAQSDPLPWPALAATVAAMAVTLAYGHWRLASPAPATQDRRSIAVGLVQANIDQAQKWDAAYRQATIDRYARLTVQAASGVDLVIWPEAATPFLFEREKDYKLEVMDLVRSRRVPLLFGSPALRYYPNGRPYLLNSAYLLSHDGILLGRYDKRHLVPFGEYIPLHSSLLFFLDKLVEGIGDFEAGAQATVLSLPSQQTQFSSNPSNGKAAFGVVICYEVIFPNLVREFAANGADFMVTITNDAWFGKSAAAYQHFGMVVLRAVENRRAFARAANTGISGFIDPQGRILRASPIFEEAAFTGTIPLDRTLTFYTNYGDVFAYACVIITGLFAWLSRQGTRRLGPYGSTKPATGR
ncbi:MAG: apolipoprotein N-acyltransferase [Nitrospirae bacterium]|nr:MAG: apolipoprotein N-acyltransferase [Nitrospirota bacterium]